MRRTAERIHKPAALARLAAHYGIEPGYRNAAGDEVVTSPQTQIQLLQSMGVDATTPRKAAAALEQVERASQGSILPPVVVARVQDGRCQVPFLAPQGVAVRWRLTLENGEQRSSTAEPLHLQADGRERRHVRRLQTCWLALHDLPWGYHRLELPELDARTSLIVTPGQCWLPGRCSQGESLWGIAAQLYLLRSQRNWGIGDFGDLAKLVDCSARRGADVLGINPLHQMFLDSPEHASPYSPASRLHLNVLYIDITALPELGHSRAARELTASPQFGTKLAECRAARLVDYTAVAALKLEVLRLLFGEFLEASDQTRRSAFHAFRRDGGESLRRSCVFQVLRQHFSGIDADLADWHRWPEEFRDASSRRVLRFEEENRHEVEFLAWLQWIADEQLDAVAQAAEAAGMTIGLYRDLAVSCDRAGAETWINPRAFLEGACVGAPPDVFNPAGQNWGLPPLHPAAMRAEAYDSFIQLLRANMRHAGGLRIDHVMGLAHLYCIPDGAPPSAGAYLSCPFDDLVGILALESHRNRCLVVGEDLGTVPEGFRQKMEQANILSYRVLFFEQEAENGGFVPPGRYPQLSLAVAGSHDLPTLRGWWEERDIELKARLGLYPSGHEPASSHALRQRDRRALLQALGNEGLIPSDAEISVEDFAIAAHRFLGGTGSALAVAQLDDLLGETEPVNVPATSTEYPNWRRRYARTLEEIASQDALWRLAAALACARRSARQSAP
jgi:4-alpha-glucanotransferase